MPSGTKVATAHEIKFDNGPMIVLYEKNGLQRSCFSIEATVTVVEALKQNCSSDHLAASVSCDGYDAIKIQYARFEDYLQSLLDLKKRISTAKIQYVSHLEAIQNDVHLQKININSSLDEMSSLACANHNCNEK